MSSSSGSPAAKRKCTSNKNIPSTSKTCVQPDPKPTGKNSLGILKLLRAREIGLVQASSFLKAAHEMKVRDFDLIESHPFDNQKKLLHTAYFCRAGINALIGVFYVKVNKMFISVVAQLHYDLSKVILGKTAYIISGSTVVDACQLTIDPDCFISVSKKNKSCGEIQIAIDNRRSDNQYDMFKFKHPGERPFWCCNGNIFTEMFALGCDREIFVYSVNGINEIRACSDNIYSLAYNDFGSVLHMGTEKGEFYTYDLRSSVISGRMKLDSNIIDDVVPLSDGRHAIVSGVTGKLQKVDMRADRVVLKFPEHNRRSRKIPVSVNESFGLVSATGADEITRVWCLTSGNLLLSFGAPSTYPARSCLVPDCTRGVIHLLQDNFIHVYCMLR